MKLSADQIDAMSPDDKIENVRAIMRLMSPGAAMALAERCYAEMGPVRRESWINTVPGGERFAALTLGCTLQLLCGDQE